MLTPQSSLVVTLSRISEILKEWYFIELEMQLQQHSVKSSLGIFLS